MESVSHHIRGETLQLLPEKAIYWPTQQALLLADLHLGKVTHFRKAGIGLPAAVEAENLDKLAQLLLSYPLKTVYLLGDLFHSELNAEWQRFKTFISRFPELHFVLIKGNHDILDVSDYQAENLSYYPEALELGPFLMTHEPFEEASDLYNICGHLHPGVVLKGRGLQALKLPCYYFGQKGLILPAFGAFTGTAKVEVYKGDAVYAISEAAVIRVV